MRSRFLWALVVVLVQAGCDGSDVRTPTEPLQPPPAPAALTSFQLSVLVTSSGRCLANAQLQLVAPLGSPVGLQTTEFCLTSTTMDTPTSSQSPFRSRWQTTNGPSQWRPPPRVMPASESRSLESRWRA